VFATNRPATNTERLTGATNKAEGKSEPDVVLARLKKAGVVRTNKAAGGNRDERVSQKAVGSNRTANRRSKEAYNAYQREYMRKRRAGL
jgi:hypothetical protein